MDAQTQAATLDRTDQDAAAPTRVRPTRPVAAAPKAGPRAGFAAALHGPIVPTMLRLGLPTLVVLVVQGIIANAAQRAQGPPRADQFSLVACGAKS